ERDRLPPREDDARRASPAPRARPPLLTLLRSAPLALSLRRAALLRQASLLRGCRRLRRAAALRHRERAAHAAGQALQRPLALDSLRARVLGDRRHARARACEQPLALRLR